MLESARVPGDLSPERPEADGRACERTCGRQRTRSQASRPASGARARARPQVIAAHALCLLLVILPHGQCQDPVAANATAAPTSASSSAPSAAEPLEAAQNASQPSKLKPVNFTQVDELFEAALDDRELVRRWRNMDAQFQEGVRSILKMVFPQIVAVSQDARVSGDCSGGILKWILSLRNLRSWAIKMLDATGKPTSGIFEGSLTMFGNLRQCLAVRAPDEDEIEITDQFEEYFRGQFCVLHLRPWLGAKRPFYNLNSSVAPLLRQNYKYYEKTLYDELAEIAVAFNFIDIRMDLCVPSTCSLADIQRVAELLSRKLEMRAKVMRCDIESRDPASTFMQHLDLASALWLAAPLSLAALALLASLLVACDLFPVPRVGPATGRARLSRLLHCLSLQSGARHLFSGTSAPPAVGGVGANAAPERRLPSLEKPLPLYGLRNLFVLWFIIVQLTVELNYQYLRESLVLRNMLLNYWPFQVIINTSMIFESLILITAFSLAYSNLEADARQLAGYLLRKFLRLAPSIATLVAITIVTPTIGLSSPVWRNFVERQAQVCKSTGHLDLFFLQNFVPFDKMCLPHTWLFCVELQLAVLSVPLVLLLKRAFIQFEDSIIIGPALAKPSDKRRGRDCRLRTALANLLCRSRAGLLGSVLLLLAAGANFALVYSNQLPPAWFHTFPDAQQKSLYFSKYLTKPWTHLTTFLVGLYAGHLCRATLELAARDACCSPKRTEDKPSPRAEGVAGRLAAEQSCCGRALLRLAAAASLLAVIFSTFAWSTGELPSPLVSALYDSLGRLIWSLALAGLMIKLCLPDRQSGRFTSLSRLFSHPTSQALGRLSFLAYLLSPYVHTLILALQEQSLFPSLYLIFHVILGNIVITYLAAMLLALLIEQPLRLAAGQLLERRPDPRAQGAASHSQASTNTTAATSAASLAG